MLHKPLFTSANVQNLRQSKASWEMKLFNLLQSHKKANSKKGKQQMIVINILSLKILLHRCNQVSSSAQDNIKINVCFVHKLVSL